MLACLADGPSLPERERTAALETADGAGFPVRVYSATEMENPEYRKNGADRCYHCKADLFFHLRRLAEESGFTGVLYGANADDLGDFRPGHRAAVESGARAPLAETGLGKAEVRALARAWNLPVHDKPASPCLSSRIAYHEEVTEEKLRRIGAAEEILRALGVRELRVRCAEDGKAARIEALPEDRLRLSDGTVWSGLEREFRALGFRKVVLDAEGFRSGKLNAALSPEEKALALAGSKRPLY